MTDYINSCLQPFNQFHCTLIDKLIYNLKKLKFLNEIQTPNMKLFNCKSNSTMAETKWIVINPKSKTLKSNVTFDFDPWKAIGPSDSLLDLASSNLKSDISIILSLQSE